MMGYPHFFIHLHFHRTTLENNFSVRFSHFPFTEKSVFSLDGRGCMYYIIDADTKGSIL